MNICRSTAENEAVRRRLEKQCEKIQGVIHQLLGDADLLESIAKETRLHPLGVKAALEHCLAREFTLEAFDDYIERVESVQRSWVNLSATSFIAVHRAILLALCESAEIRVRLSTRQGIFPRLIVENSITGISAVERLEPYQGDSVHLYGSDETIAELSGSFFPGVKLHTYGSGFGVAFIDLVDISEQRSDELAKALALDISLLDQFGCLSPRLLFLRSLDELRSKRFSENFLEALALIPRGELSEGEQAAALWFKRCQLSHADVEENAHGMVSMQKLGGRLLLPPPGRHLLALILNDWSEVEAEIEQFGASLTQFAKHEELDLGAIYQRFPAVRKCQIGEMQCPQLDGPVDRRML